MADPTVSTVEWTGDIAYNAAASAVDTALETLTSISGVLVGGSAGNYIVLFNSAPQAGTDIVSLIPDAANLTGTTPEVQVIERQRGRAGVNPIHEVRVIGATGGSFKLGYQTITTLLTELQIAMLWIDTVLRGNTQIQNLVQPWKATYISPDRLPYNDVNDLGGGSIEIVPSAWQLGIVYAQAKSSDFAPRISGERVWSEVHLAIEVQGKMGRYDPRLQAGGILIDNLFNEQREQEVSVGGTTYGTVRASDRVSEINTSAVDSSGRSIYRKGGVFEMDIKKA